MAPKSTHSSQIARVEAFAVRPKVGAALAGVGLTKFYELLNAGAFETFLDGAIRLVTVRSIRARHEQQLATVAGTPRCNPSSRRGRPFKQRKAQKQSGAP